MKNVETLWNGGCHESHMREGADVNARHTDGSRALHAAAFFGRLECVQRLLAHGADTKARNDDGETPLEGMATDWETVQFIGAILQVEMDREAILAGREAVAELLGGADGKRRQGRSVVPDSGPVLSVPE